MKDVTGDWIEVPPLPGTFVVSFGEMVPRWTGDRYLATPHRVINRTGEERFAFAFFFATNYDTVIETLPPCRRDDGKSYPSILAGDYLARRLNEIYGSRPEY